MSSISGSVEPETDFSKFWIRHFPEWIRVRPFPKYGFGSETLIAAQLHSFYRDLEPYWVRYYTENRIQSENNRFWTYLIAYIYKKKSALKLDFKASKKYSIFHYK